MKKDLKDIFLLQLKDIIYEYQESKQKGSFDNRIASDIITRSKAVVERIIGQNSEYYKRIEEIIINYQNFEDRYANKMNSIMGSIDALLKDLEANYLKSLTELIHNDIFSDFLEMADYLLREGFKDAAAVIAGSTLEEHLRKLCEKSGIDIEIINPKGERKPKKADQMNSELAKQNIYSKLEQKQITAWLDLRNNAAHGNYTEYTLDQVKLMIIGLRDFFLRNPV